MGKTNRSQPPPHEGCVVVCCVHVCVLAVFLEIIRAQHSMLSDLLESVIGLLPHGEAGSRVIQGIYCDHIFFELNSFCGCLQQLI